MLPLGVSQRALGLVCESVCITKVNPDRLLVDAVGSQPLGSARPVTATPARPLAKCDAKNGYRFERRHYTLGFRFGKCSGMYATGFYHHQIISKFKSAL
jgi:hypothetical protein